MRTRIAVLVESRRWYRVSSKSNIVLVGPMGSGKTAVGRRLAKYLEMEFVDSDTEIERRTGVDITFIFEKEGENGFRDRERAVIADLTRLKNVVLATGGGAILDADNRERLRDCGTVVYLKTSVAHQLKRTRRTENRPLLQSKDPQAVLQRLMEIRGPLYDALADITVTTGNQRIGTVADDIRACLREHGSAPDRRAAAVETAVSTDGH